MARKAKRSSGVSRRKYLVVSGAAGATALAGYAGGAVTSSSSQQGQLSGTIDIAGSSTVFPLATVMAERFRQDNPEVQINIQSTGSGGGFENFFCVGQTDFNNASRPISQEEQQLCSQNDVEPVELNVATDALTVVVNNNADWVDCITVEELAQIWSAENPPQNWSDVNSDWPDQPFDLFGPSDASGTYDYFIEAVIGEEGPGLRGDYQATEQDRTIVQGVSQSETGMGFLGFAYYSQNTDQVKALAIDNGDGCVEPSLQTAKSGEYTPLARPLFTYPKVDALSEEPVSTFAEFWLQNSTSTELVANQVGYVPLDDEQQQEQLDELQQGIENAQG